MARFEGACVGGPRNGQQLSSELDGHPVLEPAPGVPFAQYVAGVYRHTGEGWRWDANPPPPKPT